MNTKAFKAAVWILLIFSIIYIGREVSFIFIPLVVFVRLLFLPTLFALILYYLFRPIVSWLQGRNVARPLAVLMIYATLALLVVLIFGTVGVEAYEQLLELIDFFPAYLDQAINAVGALEETYLFQRFQANDMFSIEDLAESVSEFILNALPGVQEGISSAMGFLANAVILFVLLPIILFYLLKDGESFHRFITRHIPEGYREEALTILREIDHGLASFIQGQIIVSMSVGVLAYIGFLIIGIRHALILALFAVVTNFIPYIGPWIATIPAVIVGLFTSGLMALQVLIVIFIVQQIESLFITPQVMGKKLYLHPMVIIVLLLVVGNLAGLLGLIIAVPTFVIFKIIFSHLYEFLRTKKTADNGRSSKA
ncbi:AI-2E family transporter [Dethiobacter alkaliphilus]|uniref:AI-2E family transporter n=1 Tax=Dethiobacter alkaliphilus AHT 1 TaxID=555088 RepID=C0GIF5_DETAL|nr:AI-2E family transporter [Dethiobacter alkaliphilus]EEG76816.1 protein of unknown function UPF0118 [Dethiobacter alkaliphilus AHT 1]